MTSPACRLAQCRLQRSQPSSKPFAPEDKQPIVARATSHDKPVGIRRRVGVASAGEADAGERARIGPLERRACRRDEHLQRVAIRIEHLNSSSLAFRYK